MCSNLIYIPKVILIQDKTAGDFFFSTECISRKRKDFQTSFKSNIMFQVKNCKISFDLDMCIFNGLNLHINRDVLIGYLSWGFSI